MMKRMLLLLMALSLMLSAAAAESLREQVNAPETWQTEAQSPSGKTLIHVDAVVEVPDVEKVSTYEVTSRRFEVEELHALVRYAFGADSEQAQTDQENGVDYMRRPSVTGTAFYSLDWTISGITPVDYQFSNPDEESESWISASYFTLDAFPATHSDASLRYYVDPGNNLGKAVPTAEEAIAVANAMAAALYPEFTFQCLTGEPVTNMEPGLRQGITVNKEEVYDYGYRIYYTHMIDGIPLYHVDNALQEITAELLNAAITTKALPYESLFVDVGEKGLFQLQYLNPIQLKGKLQEDCTLLLFEQIMRIFHAVAPRKVAYIEQNGKALNELYITRIAFGYMAVPMRSDPTRYELIPVWDFFGEFAKDGQQTGETMDMYSYLTINAIDGTVIDRTYGY